MAWIGGLLAGAAVAACVAVAYAPHLLPRVATMAGRFVTMLRDVLGRVGRIFANLVKTRQARRIDTVAGRLHGSWRAPRRFPQGGYEPRIKTTTDRAWIRQHGTDQVDIASSRYKDLPGDTYTARMEAMMADLAWLESLSTTMGRFNAFLAEAAETVRPLFGGRITYASAPWESVDWAPFDLVGVDAYRAAYNADTFVEEMRGHFKLWRMDGER